MPWRCGSCDAEVRLDDLVKCPGCGVAKDAWSVVAARTRAFVVSAKKFELLRGVGTESLRAGDPALSGAEVVEAPEVRSLPKADLRRTLLAGRVPAPRDLLFVRLHPKGARDLTVSLAVGYEGREVEELAFPPFGAPPADVAAVDVPFVFVHGDGDADDLVLPGVHTVDLSEDAPAGHAPSVELRALGKPPRALPVRPAGLGAGTGVVVPGALFAFDSAFPSPAILWHLDLIDEALEAQPDLRLAVFGHADPSGDAAYNKRLSDRRAKAVLALLAHDRGLLDEVAREDGWDARHDQAMLRALGCDPGAIDGAPGALTAEAVRGFQRGYRDGHYHEDEDGPPADPDLAVDGVLGERTRAALRDAYVALSPVRVPEERLAPPRFAGCSEFNLTGGGDAALDRRVVLALLPPDATTDPPCRVGDAGACTLDAPAPRRCGFYGRTVLEEVRPEAPRFWDFLWLRERDGRAHLSALTSLPDGTPVSFTVHRCTRGLPAPPPESSSGAARPDPGPVLGRVEGRVMGGVAFARWRPPGGYCPFDHERCWQPDETFDDAALDEDALLASDDDPTDLLLARPGVEPPVFIVEGGGHWACSDPPGRRLSRLRFDADGPTTALLADGTLLRFDVQDGRAQVEEDAIVVSVVQAHELSFAEGEGR